MQSREVWGVAQPDDTTDACPSEHCKERRHAVMHDAMGPTMTSRLLGCFGEDMRGRFCHVGRVRPREGRTNLLESFGRCEFLIKFRRF